MKVAASLLLLLASASALAAKSNAEGIAGLLKGQGVSQAVAQSVLVVRLSDGKALYEQDADQLMSPASVTKVVTTAAVLTKFSPVHTFKTQLFHTGGRKNERVLGDLVVVGDGDPFLVSEKLWQLAADIKNMGIREFAGDLVIDNSLFDDETRDEGRKGAAKATRNAYDAPITAFGVNFNTFAVTVAPGAAAGRPAAVSLDPYPLRHVSIDNEVRTGKAKSAKSLEVRRVETKEGERLVASGAVPEGGGIYKVYRSVGDPVTTAGEYLKAFLRAEGVTVRGNVKQGAKPADATPLLDLESYDLRRISQGLNTFSNNYIADVLVKRLGAAFPRSGNPDQAGSGTYANGLAVISDFLRKDVGIKGEFVLQNGSGLDTDNRLSARHVVDVLTYMERRMDLFPDFLASLPASGWDGTLKKRFHKGEQEVLNGFFRAKTGTLTAPVAVAALAGYFRHPKHGMTAFCILENGQVGKTQPAITDLRDRQDRVLVALMDDL